EWKARTSATVLQLAWAVVFIRASYVHSTHWSDWAGTIAWYASLWGLPRFCVHREKTPLNVLGFISGALPLILQPQSAIARRVSYIGAIHGSASVMVMCRALQYYLNQDAFKGWKTWRRTFFVSAWGWHDFRQIKYVGDAQLVPELKRLAK